LAAASLVSAAAALVYRRPKAAAAATENVKEAATELADDFAIAAKVTSKAARAVRRKVVTAVDGVVRPTASATQDSSDQKAERGSSRRALDASAVSGTSAQQGTRKRRSDAGVKRGPRNTFGSEAAGTTSGTELPPATSGNMATSALAMAANAMQPGEEPKAALSAEHPVMEAAHN
jgi:hypothetical protein